MVVVFYQQSAASPGSHEAQVSPPGFPLVEPVSQLCRRSPSLAAPGQGDVARFNVPLVAAQRVQNPANATRQVRKDLGAEHVDRLHFDSVDVEVPARLSMADVRVRRWDVPSGEADVRPGWLCGARGPGRRRKAASPKRLRSSHIRHWPRGQGKCVPKRPAHRPLPGRQQRLGSPSKLSAGQGTWAHPLRKRSGQGSGPRLACERAP